MLIHFSGNRRIREITNQGDYELRIDLTNFDEDKRYAQYKVFKLGNATSNYKLSVSGYGGDAGKYFSFNRQ